MRTRFGLSLIRGFGSRGPGISLALAMSVMPSLERREDVMEHRHVRIRQLSRPWKRKAPEV